MREPPGIEDRENWGRIARVRDLPTPANRRKNRQKYKNHTPNSIPRLLRLQKKLLRLLPSTQYPLPSSAALPAPTTSYLLVPPPPPPRTSSSSYLLLPPPYASSYLLHFLLLLLIPPPPHASSYLLLMPPRTSSTSSSSSSSSSSYLLLPPPASSYLLPPPPTSSYLLLFVCNLRVSFPYFSGGGLTPPSFMGFRVSRVQQARHSCPF